MGVSAVADGEVGATVGEVFVELLDGVVDGFVRAVGSSISLASSFSVSSVIFASTARRSKRFIGVGLSQPSKPPGVLPEVLAGFFDPAPEGDADGEGEGAGEGDGVADTDGTGDGDTVFEAANPAQETRSVRLAPRALIRWKDDFISVAFRDFIFSPARPLPQVSLSF